MPVATQPQHLVQLANANRIRFARTDLKRDIKAGHVAVAEVLLGDIPEWLEKMAVTDLVCAVHRVGTRRAERVFRRIPVHPLQEVGWLTMRQRIALSVEAEKLSPPKQSSGVAG